MARLEVYLDATEILKWIRIGQESMFLQMHEFDELESLLNLYRISLLEDD